jgi:hypothetical protein
VLQPQVLLKKIVVKGQKPFKILNFVPSIAISLLNWYFFENLDPTQ